MLYFLPVLTGGELWAVENLVDPCDWRDEQGALQGAFEELHFCLRLREFLDDQFQFFKSSERTSGAAKKLSAETHPIHAVNFIAAHAFFVNPVHQPFGEMAEGRAKKIRDSNVAIFRR